HRCRWTAVGWWLRERGFDVFANDASTGAGAVHAGKIDVVIFRNFLCKRTGFHGASRFGGSGCRCSHGLLGWGRSRGGFGLLSRSSLRLRRKLFFLRLGLCLLPSVFCLNFRFLLSV